MECEQLLRVSRQMLRSKRSRSLLKSRLTSSSESRNTWLHGELLELLWCSWACSEAAHGIITGFLQSIPNTPISSLWYS